MCVLNYHKGISPSFDYFDYRTQHNNQVFSIINLTQYLGNAMLEENDSNINYEDQNSCKAVTHLMN